MAPANEMTGGEALARVLEAHEVGPMFGMGGFQLLPFYDAVRRLGLRHSLINDERCGIFAADAYAKITGRVGVCDATLGPGATNLVTGMVEALNAGELTADKAARIKLYSSEMLGRVVDECLQFFGGYGYMEEYPVARAYCDARVARIFGGTSEIMKEIISKSLGLTDDGER